MTQQRIIILGAGAAAAAAARTLSNHDDVQVTLVAATGEVPYTRMLIKGIAFGPTPPELIKLVLPQVQVLADTAIEVDIARQRVRLVSGAHLNYDALIVATGSQPRTLPPEAVAGEAAGSARMGTLYDMADALRIRELLTLGRPVRVAIYGGGIIAAETASSLQAEGHVVTMIARSHIPGETAFGAPVAARLAQHHASKIDTRFGHRIQHVDLTDPGAVTVTLDNDETVVADFVLLALGTTPAGPTPWTAGLEVDERLRGDTPRVYAAGGVATHHDNVLGTWRLDHWEDASAQGVHAARSALHDLGLGADPGVYLPRSSYMAMVYGQMISGTGYTGVTETALIREDDEFVVQHEIDGAIVGVTGIDAVGTVYQWGQRLHTVRT